MSKEKQGETEDNVIPEESLQAMKMINEEVKELARKAESANDGRENKKYSYKKNALYDLKREFIEQHKSDASRIELHNINGGQEKYYYFVFDGDGFHLSTDEIHVEDERVDDVKYIKGLKGDGMKWLDGITIDECLQTIYDNHGINANDFLEEKNLSHNRMYSGITEDITWDINIDYD